MQTLHFANPYIYNVKNTNLRSYATAPLWLKLFSFLTAATTLFYAFHLVMQFLFDDHVQRSIWLDEIHFYIPCFFPVFLLITSTFNERRNLNRVVWIASIVYALCLLINIPNAYDIISVYHLQYPTSVALLVMLTAAIIHFVKKRKNAVDVLKLVWLFCLVYGYAVPNFITKYHQAGWFLIGMQFLFPVMMTIALVQFFQKPKPTDHAA
jgi:hypothetical protein